MEPLALLAAAAAWWLHVAVVGGARTRRPPPPSQPSSSPADAVATADAQSLARTPQPPYWAVIFTSTRRHAADGGNDDGYADAAARMDELARGSPGYLGVDSVRGADGLGVTVSYWRDEASIVAWKRHAEHAAAQARGRAQWYAGYTTRVAEVRRAYAFGDAAGAAGL
jgi:heme-degrading monooxygenase HmoA